MASANKVIFQKHFL